MLQNVWHTANNKKKTGMFVFVTFAKSCHVVLEIEKNILKFVQLNKEKAPLQSLYKVGW